jgi:hypothetical protein
MFLRTALAVFSCSYGFAMYIGNPAQPGVLEKGIVLQYDLCSFRCGYLDDWVYAQQFQDEFYLAGVTPTKTSIELSTYAGILTLNFKDKLDLYGIVGSSRMQIDQEIFTKRALGWGCGIKWLIAEYKNFFLGADAKYFETDQKPRFFIIEGVAYNIASNYRLNYHEVQVAIGVAYRAVSFCPYMNATYISTKIRPQPTSTLIRLPDADELAEVQTKSIVSKNNLGLAVGLTLLDSEKASLACEWRGFNQSGVNVNLEVRF